jgi:transcriptional regulator with XRE-family HTH domain
MNTSQRATDETPISTLIHEHQIRTGMTDGELGDLVGAHQTQISRWKRGVGVPRQSFVTVLAEVLDLDEATVERSRQVAERLRLDVVSRKTTDPREELLRVKAELRKAQARIRRLEDRLNGSE